MASPFAILNFKSGDNALKKELLFFMSSLDLN